MLHMGVAVEKNAEVLNKKAGEDEKNFTLSWGVKDVRVFGRKW